jgi:L-2-aminoadipate reductase
LVRRDKDEEPTLVSYIVPRRSKELDDLLSADDEADSQNDELVRGLRKYRTLIREIRNHLKSKLPSYAVPTGSFPVFIDLGPDTEVFVPLVRMPLNPNGKVDKPALPFPDTAQLAAASRRARRESLSNGLALTQTQAMVQEIWLKTISHVPRDISIQDNFFDIGGHSILATRVVFEIRKRFAVDLPLGILFQHPTIAGLSAEIDRRNEQSLDVTSRPPSRHLDSNMIPEYSADLVTLLSRLPESYAQASTFSKDQSVNVLLTGATGFLGAFVLRDLLSRQHPSTRVIAHVRADTPERGLERVINNCKAHGVWNPSWKSRLEIVTGSLEKDLLGLPQSVWDDLLEKVDVVIHNGAKVRP